MQRTFAQTRQERAIADQLIYDPLAPGARLLVGRVLARGLADEHRDHEYLIVDGVDGRTHYVRTGASAIDDGDDLFGEARGIAGATVRIAPRAAGPRKADHVIAEVAAANGGRYDVEAHRAYDPKASLSFIEAHIRRLEAIRRASHAVARDASGRWSVPEDYLERVADVETEKLRARPVEVTILATQAPKALSRVDGATWLDHEIAAENPISMRESGFGSEARQAIEVRRRWLAAEGLLADSSNRDARASLIATLRSRELNHAAAKLAGELGLPCAPLSDKERLEGVYRRRVDLVSGRFALIERAHDFTLVPWRPAMERARGRHIRVEVKGERVNWSLGRFRAGAGRDDL